MSNNAVDWATNDGWFVDLNPGNSSPGERVNLDPQLVLGTLVVASNVPNNTACSVGGDSWLYQLDYRSGSYVASATGELVAQKITGETLVGVVVVRLPSGVIKAIATGGTGEKRTIGVNVGGGGGSGRRVSWRELIQ
jgi:type IV pilus assembly protein PilY1